jgi:hypothetical protein
MKRFFPLCVLLLLTGLVAACGVKPHHVDPPVDSGADTFPRTYPAPDAP